MIRLPKRAMRAQNVLFIGEMSAGRQALEVAPGTQAILDALCDRERRPFVPREPLTFVRWIWTRPSSLRTSGQQGGDSTQHLESDKLMSFLDDVHIVSLNLTSLGMGTWWSSTNFSCAWVGFSCHLFQNVAQLRTHSCLVPLWFSSVDWILERIGQARVAQTSAVLGQDPDNPRSALCLGIVVALRVCPCQHFLRGST